MSDTRQRARELVEQALAPEQGYFTMDDLLGELDMTHFEPDPRIPVERANYEFNYGAVDRAYREGTEKPRVHGIPYALTGDFDEHEVIPNLRRAAVARHRAAGSENLNVIDYEKASDGTQLPAWSIDDPTQANVMRGLIASNPLDLHVLRGDYTYTELARRIWDGEIPTRCNVNVARNCDLKATPPLGWTDRKVWWMFTAQAGEYLVYFTICEKCFHTMWPMADRTHYYEFDPKYETGDDLARKRSRFRNWPGPKAR